MVSMMIMMVMMLMMTMPMIINEDTMEQFQWREGVKMIAAIERLIVGDPTVLNLIGLLQC